LVKHSAFGVDRHSNPPHAVTLFSSHIIWDGSHVRCSITSVQTMAWNASLEYGNRSRSTLQKFSGTIRMVSPLKIISPGIPTTVSPAHTVSKSQTDTSA